MLSLALPPLSVSLYMCTSLSSKLKETYFPYFFILLIHNILHIYGVHMSTFFYMCIIYNAQVRVSGVLSSSVFIISMSPSYFEIYNILLVNCSHPSLLLNIELLSSNCMFVSIHQPKRSIF